MLGSAREVRGGISSVVNAYFNSTLSRKYNIIYIPSHIDGNKPAKLIQFIKSLFLFQKYIFSKRVGIVHIHSASRASFYRKSIFVILSKILGKKIVFHIHGAEFNIFYHREAGYIKKYFIRKVICLADELIVLSEQWKKDIEKMIRTRKEIKVVLNPAAMSPLKRANRNIINTNTLKILFMGRLEERKGVYDLVKSASKVLLQEQNIKFVLCGDGEIEKVRRIIQKRGLARYFDIPGWITDKIKYFREADIYILPSYYEGLPMSILEAASYGLPIISTPVGGIPEVVEDGLNGFLINPGDIETMTERLLTLILSPELRSRMGQCAHNKIKTKFDVNTIVKQLDSIYQELLIKT